MIFFLYIPSSYRVLELFVFATDSSLLLKFLFFFFATHNFFGSSKLLSLSWNLGYSMAKGLSDMWVWLVLLILVGSGGAAH